METSPVRDRYGSPEFYKILGEMADIHDRKSHDYASDKDPFANYHFAGKLALLFSHSEQDAGFVGRIAEKLYRLANLEKSQKTPLNESIEDTEKDICVIVALWVASRRERRKANQYNQINKGLGAQATYRGADNPEQLKQPQNQEKNYKNPDNNLNRF
jgi:hypothetical protein